MTRANKSNPTLLKKLSDIENLLKKKDDKPLNFKEACAYLGFAPSYLYKLTYRKVIPHYKPSGKMLFFSKNELDEWIFDKRNERRKKKDSSTSSEQDEEEEEEEGESSILRQAQDDKDGDPSTSSEQDEEEEDPSILRQAQDDR